MESPFLISSMIRKSFVMQLAEGAEREYHQRHNPIWRELEETLHAQGVHNYSTFLHPNTRQLFAYAEIEDEFRWKAIAQTAVCRRCGLRDVAKQRLRVASLSVDSWGVDYVLLNNVHPMLSLPFHYLSPCKPSSRLNLKAGRVHTNDSLT